MKKKMLSVLLTVIMLVICGVSAVAIVRCKNNKVINFNYNGEMVYSKKKISTNEISADASNYWSDGTNIYYSRGENQYELDESSSTWKEKTWRGLTDFYGYLIWTDGAYVYYSNGSMQYVLDKSSSTWKEKTWTGLNSTEILNFSGNNVVTDGENIYFINTKYSHNDQYYYWKLNKSTSTWNQAAELTSCTPDYIWTDGTNLYCSNGNDQYVLDKATLAKSEKTWGGLTSFYGKYIWTDEKNVYYSYGGLNYVLNESTSGWEMLNWNDSTLKRINLKGIDNGYYTMDESGYFYEVTLKNISSIDTKKGEKVKIPEVISRDKGKVKEWNTKADGTGTKYTVGQTISDLSSDLTLYAIWED